MLTVEQRLRSNTLISKYMENRSLQRILNWQWRKKSIFDRALTEDQKCIHWPLLRGTAVTVHVAFVGRLSRFGCELLGRNGWLLFVLSVHLHLIGVCVSSMTKLIGLWTKVTKRGCGESRWRVFVLVSGKLFGFLNRLNVNFVYKSKRLELKSVWVGKLRSVGKRPCVKFDQIIRKVYIASGFEAFSSSDQRWLETISGCWNRGLIEGCSEDHLNRRVLSNRRTAERGNSTGLDRRLK